MQMSIDNTVYDQFCWNKSRYKEDTSDNEFLTILVKHFETCNAAGKSPHSTESCSDSTNNQIKETSPNQDDSDSFKQLNSSDNLPNPTTSSSPTIPPANESKMEIDEVNPLSEEQPPPPPLRSVTKSANTIALDLTKKPDASPSRLDGNFTANLLPKSLKSCPECKYSTNNFVELSQHFELNHQQEGMFSCTCGSSYDWLPKFLRHYITCPIAATDLNCIEEVAMSDSSLVKQQQTDDEAGVSSPHNIPENSSSDGDRCTPPKSDRSTLNNSTESKFSHFFLAKEQKQMIAPLNLTTESPSIPMPFRCKTCDKCFLHKEHFHGHLSQCRGGSDHQSAPPPPPQYKPSDRSNQVVHSPDNSRFKCSHCVKSFKSKALLDQHLHIHYPPRYTCRYCGKKYRWPPVFYHHQRTCKKRHEAAMEAMSTLSGSKSHHPDERNRLAQQHLDGGKLHSQSEVTKKLLAPKLDSFYNSQQMQNLSNALHHQQQQQQHHQQQQQRQQLLSCICSASFNDLNSYIAHVNSCPLLLSQLTVVNSSHPLQNVSQLPTNNQSLNASSINDLAMKDVTSSIQQAISLANSSMNTHSSPIMSMFQSANFLKTPSLNQSAGSPQPPPLHVTSVHSTPSGTPPESVGNNFCDQCGKDFSSRLSLKQHIEGKHSAEGKYICPHCNRRYRWGASFYYHKKSCPGYAEASDEKKSELADCNDPVVDSPAMMNASERGLLLMKSESNPFIQLSGSIPPAASDDLSRQEFPNQPHRTLVESLLSQDNNQQSLNAQMLLSALQAGRFSYDSEEMKSNLISRAD